MANKSAPQVLRPKEAESVRHIHSTKEDRATHLKQFREEKKYQEKVKDEN